MDEHSRSVLVPAQGAELRPKLRFAETLADYQWLFDASTPGQLPGEASTSYLFSRRAVAEILRVNSIAKIIAMVRSPVDMVVSYHAQEVYTFEENERDFAIAWGLSGRRARGERVGTGCRAPQYLDYKSVGRLGEQLERLKRLVPADQLHIIVFDGLKTEPAVVYRETLRFPGSARSSARGSRSSTHAGDMPGPGSLAC